MWLGDQILVIKYGLDRFICSLRGMNLVSNCFKGIGVTSRKVLSEPFKAIKTGDQI
jgi:hypothetical protein